MGQDIYSMKNELFFNAITYHSTHAASPPLRAAAAVGRAVVSSVLSLGAREFAVPAVGGERLAQDRLADDPFRLALGADVGVEV